MSEGVRLEHDGAVAVVTIGSGDLNLFVVNGLFETDDLASGVRGFLEGR